MATMPKSKIKGIPRGAIRAQLRRELRFLCVIFGLSLAVYLIF